MKNFWHWLLGKWDDSIASEKWMDEKIDNIWITQEPIIYTPHKLIPIKKKRKPKWIHQ